MNFKRFAIYYTPASGAFADFGAAWLGWDSIDGKAVPHPDIMSGIGDITSVPRKYGFHGTLKPPFRLANGYALDDLQEALETLVQTLRTVQLDWLQVSQIGRFIALVPTGDVEQLRHLAASIVRELDQFRAPATQEELAKRRKSNLSVRQDQLLQQWGYPYIMDEFRFHITLSGPLDDGLIQNTKTVLETHLKPVLPRPFIIGDLTLLGEAEDGFFHEIHRYALTG